MPRQDVPYGGAICRLRERIAEIFDKLGEKLHTINGVPGDGDGNVKIVSGSSAVVISNDPTQNEIAVSLDTSQLPAASVSSVNTMSGDVIVTAADIPSNSTRGVQGDINTLYTDTGNNTAAIAAEALARQNADSALQTNINTVSAGIPAAAAAAVAADPTVAYVASEINNKVDKITSGSSLKAYSHTGATQGETSIVDGTTANTIGIRDANGRMQAADPASGATDKTLTTANWISQTGDSAPNNLLHKTGTETKAGTLKLSAYEAMIYEVSAGNAPALAGNTVATQRILNQYINSGKDGAGVWMVRNTIYQGANNKGYSRILYLRRLDASDNLMQCSFTFSIDANGKAHLTATDNDGTGHTIL